MKATHTIGFAIRGTMDTTTGGAEMRTMISVHTALWRSCY
jgi:hypothetical protein